MSAILWAILAIAAGLFVLTALTWLRRPRMPALEPGTEFPPTPLQRLARWGLVLGALPGLAAVGMVLHYGAQTIYDDDHLRMGFTLLLLAIVAVFLVVTVRLRNWVVRRDGAGNGGLDERDRAILGRAPSLQSAAMLVTLAAWMIGLVEHFHTAGAVPVFYLYLIFWSCWAVSLLAFPLGILLGYRRS